MTLPIWKRWFHQWFGGRNVRPSPLRNTRRKSPWRLDALEPRETPAQATLNTGFGFAVAPQLTPGELSLNATKVDASGNVYVAGSFKGTVDGLTSNGSSDAYVAKYTSAGALTWAKSFGGTADDAVNGLALDASNNVIVTGKFTGLTDLDPGAGVALYGDSHQNAFVMKLDTNGNFVWATPTVSSSPPFGFNTDTAVGNAVAVDSAGNPFVTGSFQGLVNFDTSYSDPKASVGGFGSDIFVWKLNAADGSSARVTVAGGSSTDSGRGIAVDTSGNAYVTGYYQGTVDFDPGAGTKNLTAPGFQDAFVWKLTSAGALSFISTPQSTGFASGDGGTSANAVFLSGGNVFVAGSFSGTADFDPGAGTQSRSATGQQDAFAWKLTGAGAFSFASVTSGSGFSAPTVATGIVVDGSGNPILTGTFAGTTDFDPDAAKTQNRTATGGANDTDVFFWKLNPTGGFSLAQVTGTAFPDAAQAAAISGANVTIAGQNGTGIATQSRDVSPGGFYQTRSASTGAVVRTVGGAIAGAAFTTAAVTNAAGDTYVVGSFRGTVDFNPAAGTTNLTSKGDADVFVAKFTSAGVLSFAKSVGGPGHDFATGVALSSTGNVLISGSFNGTVDFDPGTGTQNRTSAGGTDAFVLSLTNAGAFVFANRVGGTLDDTATGVATTAAGSGAVFVVGTFQGTADFDPGAGTSNKTAASFSGDGFVWKLTPAGAFTSVVTLGNASGGTVVPTAVAADATGNVYTGGTFTGTVDFDPGAGTQNRTAANFAGDLFVSKLTSTNAFSYAIRAGDTSAFNGVRLNGLAVDTSNNLYATGSFSGTIDFNPAAGVNALTAQSFSGDAYVWKLTSTGAFGFANALGSSNGPSIGAEVALDTGGNVYVTGTVASDADFDPGVPVVTIGNNDLFGTQSAFVWKLKSNGAYVWASQSDGTQIMGTPTTGQFTISSFAGGIGIGVDSSNKVYTTGNFDQYIDLNAGTVGPGLGRLTAPRANLFVSQLTQPAVTTLGLSQSADQDLGIGTSTALATAGDASGNVYVVGTFTGTVDFDPGTGVVNLFSSEFSTNSYLAKYNSTGGLVFAKALTGLGTVQATEIALDGSGNIYVGGTFSGTIDFDPGTGTQNRSPVGFTDTFAMELTTAGAFTWVATAGGSSATISPTGLAIDGSGNVYVSGTFTGTADFDPSGATQNRASVNGSQDGFLWKLTTAGLFSSARGIGGKFADDAAGVAVDSANNVYVVGSFESTVDFDSSAATQNRTSVGADDVYVLKMTGAGAFTYVKTVGAPPDVFPSYPEDFTTFFYADVRDIEIDGSNNVYVLGTFQGTADFDPNAGTQNRSSSSFTDGFLWKLTSAGNFSAVTTALPSTVVDLDVDASGVAYIAGTFNFTTDFDPGVGSQTLTPVGSRDGFLLRLTSAGAFSYVKALGAQDLGPTSDSAVGVALAGSGVAVVGEFGLKPGPVQSFFGPQVTPFFQNEANTAFVRRFDAAAGTKTWEVQQTPMGLSSVRGIAVDSSGNTYTVGVFAGTVDLASGSAATTKLTSAGGADIFVVKSTAAGAITFAKAIGGTGDDVANGIVVNSSGVIFITGSFQGTVDFDPGTGTQNRTSAGGNDAFALKLTGAGAFTFASTAGGTGDEVGNAIAVDTGGNVYVGGSFNGTADFDPSAGVKNLVAASSGSGFGSNPNDAFAWKLSTAGALTWARSVGGTGDDTGEGIAVDGTGNVYLVGGYSGTADFDPGVAKRQQTSTTATEAYVLKLTSAGLFSSVRTLPGSGGTGSKATDVTVDGSNNVFVTGTFGGTVDFDPGAGVASRTATGPQDAFAWKLTSAGAFGFAAATGATGFSQTPISANGIRVDSGGNVYIVGQHVGAVDFDPDAGSAVLIASDGLGGTSSPDAYVWKLTSAGKLASARTIGPNAYGAALAVDTNSVYVGGSFSGTVNPSRRQVSPAGLLITGPADNQLIWKSPK